MTAGQFPDTGQPFPAGAATEVGQCDGLCGRSEVEVTAARIGPSWRLAVQEHLCAECLADFVVGAPVVGGHVYAECTDGLFREIQSDGVMVGEP